eukprot:2701260-Alexandrium_andersonii.AAC.1
MWTCGAPQQHPSDIDRIDKHCVLPIDLFSDCQTVRPPTQGQCLEHVFVLVSVSYVGLGMI